MADFQDGETATERNAELVELLGDGPIDFPELAAKVFQPWHRPRKQYVRDHQWIRELGFLARDLHLDGTELRYLTLPGDDLLDVRHIHDEICIDHDLKLRYLGFNTSATTRDPSGSAMNSSIFAIRQLKNVHHESRVIVEDIRKVGVERSVSWQTVRQAGKFHAVNLDLCGGFADGVSGPGLASYFRALDWIMSNQGSSQEESLLFLTTRIDESSISDSSHEALNSLTVQLLKDCARYAEQMEQAFGMSQDIGARELENQIASPTLFVLGLISWLTMCAIRNGLSVSVKSLMSYRTGSDHGDDDIISIALRLKPNPMLHPDPTGLSVAPSLQPTADQKLCSQSDGVPARVSETRRVDEMLKTDYALFQAAYASAAKLLGESGYDEAAYSDWVMSESERYATPPVE
jgi:hypothetical protein